MIYWHLIEGLIDPEILGAAKRLVSLATTPPFGRGTPEDARLKVLPDGGVAIYFADYPEYQTWFQRIPDGRVCVEDRTEWGFKA